MVSNLNNNYSVIAVAILFAITLTTFVICEPDHNENLVKEPTPIVASQAPESQFKQRWSKTVQEADTILNFTVQTKPSLKPCLMAQFSLSFDIKYEAEDNNTMHLQTVRINVNETSGHHGTCEKEFDTLFIEFNHDWLLVLNYTLKDPYYSLDTIKLKYTVDQNLFPNAAAFELGRHDLEAFNLKEFQVNMGKSFKCFSKTRIGLRDNVTIEFKNYQAQAFISEDSKTEGFDTAVECVADIVKTNKLIPIVIGSILAVLIVLVLIAYIVGRHRYRPSYQQV